MNKEHKKNVCPVCNSTNIIYGSREMECVDSESMFYPAECQDCGATFEEWYKFVFDGHENIETNKE